MFGHAYGWGFIFLFTTESMWTINSFEYTVFNFFGVLNTQQIPSIFAFVSRKAVHNFDNFLFSSFLFTNNFIFILKLRSHCFCSDDGIFSTNPMFLWNFRILFLIFFEVPTTYHEVSIIQQYLVIQNCYTEFLGKN